jgi:hypothetical protein
VVDKAAAKAFALSRRASLGAAEIRLTQIAAKLDVALRLGFVYLWQDGRWRPASDGLVTGSDPSVEDIFPEAGS